MHALLVRFHLRSLVLFAATVALVTAQAKASQPTVFAPGTISSPAYELGPTFTPDGSTCYFLRFGVGMKDGTIMESRLVEGRWTEAKPVPFSGAHADGAPSLSPDGTLLLFASRRPLPGEQSTSQHWHIWRVKRIVEDWSTPEPLPPPVLDPGKSQSSPSLTRSGTLYFTIHSGNDHAGWDIYRARPAAEGYAPPERVPAVNTRFDEPWVCVAADESLLLYAGRRRGDTLGESDLFLARNWDQRFPEIEVRSVREPINSPRDEVCPRIDADGRTLYFTRDGDVYSTALEVAPVDDGCWNKRAPMQHAREWPQAVVAGGLVYVYGGIDAARAGVNVAEEYDPTTDSWRTIAAIPEGWWASLVAVGSRVLLLQRGGGGVAEYDRPANRWNILTAGDPGVAAIHDELPFRIRSAVVGGRVFVLRNQDGGTGDDDLSSFVEFDLRQLRWIERAGMPTPTIQLTTVGDRIFAFGGGDRADGVFAYDPGTDTWTTKAPMRLGRWETAVATLNNRVYLIGGHRMINGDVHDTVEEYDPTLDRWLQQPRHRRALIMATAVTLGDRILVLGGRRLEPGRLWGPVSNDVLEFSPHQD